MVKAASLISIACCLLFICGYAQGITTYFGPVYVRVGDDFSVRCSTNHFRFPKWSINGKRLEEDSTIQIIQPKENGRQEAELRVFHAGLQHAGAYSCDPFDSDKHHVYVVDTESVNGTKRCFLINPETSLALTCEPESMAPFFWYYGKNEARYLPKGHVELRTAQLLFHGVQLLDAGRYICRSAKNSSVETTYHLVKHHSSVTLIGEMVSLRPTYDPVESLGGVGVSQSQLCINILINEYELSLAKAPIVTKREPTWIKVARIGSSVALDCDFTAEPQPHIEWFIGSDHAELTKRAYHRVHISTNPSTAVPNSRLIVQACRKK